MRLGYAGRSRRRWITGGRTVRTASRLPAQGLPPRGCIGRCIRRRPAGCSQPRGARWSGVWGGVPARVEQRGRLRARLLPPPLRPPRPPRQAHPPAPLPHPLPLLASPPAAVPPRPPVRFSPASCTSTVAQALGPARCEHWRQARPDRADGFCTRHPPAQANTASVCAARPGRTGWPGVVYIDSDVLLLSNVTSLLPFPGAPPSGCAGDEPGPGGWGCRAVHAAWLRPPQRFREWEW